MTTFYIMTEVAERADGSGFFRATASGLPEGTTRKDADEYAAVCGRLNAFIQETDDREVWAETREAFRISGYVQESRPSLVSEIVIRDWCPVA